QERVGRLFQISFGMWANGLRGVDEGGVTVGELRARLGAACNLPGLERWGWLRLGRERGEDGVGTRRGIKDDPVGRPARAGTFARGLWARVVEEVGGRWSERFGADTVEGVRRALGARKTSMPWAMPELYPADGFRARVVGETESADERPVVALLGQ